MKKYKEYKDSGVKWIGTIPSYWKRMRYKDIFQILDEKVGTIKDLTLLSLTKKGVIIRDLSEGKGKFPKDFESYKIVHPNNLILCLFDVDETPRTVGVSNTEGMITGAYDIFSVKNALLDYVYYLYLSFDDKKCLKPLYKGLRKVIPLPVLLSSYIYLPLEQEQQAIVSYLDKKVGKIDNYIVTAEKKIAALNELKQVTIADAVTHGINPNVPMKNSGIPWIGMVPEHWIKLRAKNIFKRQFREVRDNDDIVTCFRDGQVTLRKNRRREGFTESLKEIGYQGIRRGDLVLHQMDAFAGSIGVSDSDGKGTPVYICCLPIGESNVYYYAYLLREMARTGFIKSLYRGIRERSSDFRFETFSVQWLPVLPLSEQNEIVAYIDRKVAQIDRMKTAEFAQIEKLKEYKQSLISDVVTGKVKVTND